MRSRVILAVFLMLILALSLAATGLQKGTTDLNIAFNKIAESQEMLPVIIVMKEQYDSQLLYSQVRDLTRTERRQFTINTLQNFSAQNQSEIRALLLDLEKEKLVEELSFLWITNVIYLKASREALLELDKRNDIVRLEHDPLRKILIGDNLDFENAENFHTPELRDGEREIVYNVNIMNVPDVWAEGFYGEGVVVAVLDTGVNYNHTDIANQMWISAAYPNHGYNYVNNSHNTLDDHGHGTHCAGTIAGDGTSGTQTGVAPQSSIMALKVMDADGSGQQSYVWNAIQFAVVQGADVMSLSLGWLHAWSPDRSTWRAAMVNALSAGVVASVAAGNEGAQQYMYPVPDNVRTPGDCPPPWLNPDQTLTGGISSVITVGASNSSDQVANFSGRGPVTWQSIAPFNDYPYNPGIGLIRPDVVAPGVNVVSLRHNNNTGYVTMSGTSMAAPNNAGVLALILSKDPTLLPEDLSEILEESALPLSTVKNNVSGSGRVDAFAAVSMVTADSPPNPPRYPIPDNGATNVSLLPTLSWTNGGGALVYFVSLGTDNPPSNIVSNFLTTDRFFQVTEQLEHSTTYYWRVDALNNNGQTQGNVWSFTTGLPVSENFETGNFSRYDWEFVTSGTVANQWYITSDESFSGTYSARSGIVGDSAMTIMLVTLEIIEPGVISFYRKTSTEENDILRFFINNSVVGFWSGEQDWDTVSFPVQAGTQIFRWIYIKNPTGSGGQDAVWIDDITFPPHVYNDPIVSPNSLQYEIDLEYILLDWELENIRPDDPPVLLGFNVYQAVGQQTTYVLLNQVPVQESEYQVLINSAGEHHYYVTAVYDLGESEPSETINLTIYPAPGEPLTDPAGGTFEHPVTVQINSDDPEVVIYYTLDGSLPTSNSLLYSNPVEITQSLILKVKPFKEGHLPGNVLSYQFQIATSADEDLLSLVTALKIYPNPFILNAQTMRSSQTLNIDYSVANSAEYARIEIYNIKGQRIRTFQPPLREQQINTITWDLRGTDGKQVGSGIYLIRMTAGTEVLNRRIMIVK